MATASVTRAEVGTVKVAIGEVKVVGVDGVTRTVGVGDKVYAKEVVETGANSVVQVQLANGNMIDMGRESKMTLEGDILAGTQETAPRPAVDDAARLAAEAKAAQIAALQARLDAGDISVADELTKLQGTAAGGQQAPGAGAGGDAGGSEPPPNLDQANQIGPVTSGFNTLGANIAFPNTIPFNELPASPIVSVSVGVEIGDPPPPPPGTPNDVPLARTDVDAVPAGTFVATGNVITGVGTTSGSAGIDIPGADGAIVSVVTSPSGSPAIVSPGGVITLVGLFGTLSINPDGGYVYDRNPGSPDGVVDKFTYTLTDGSGDISKADLLIDIGTPVDVPIARTDVDVVPAGSSIATGNVITGANTTSGAAGADTVGAEGAIVTTVTSPSGNPPNINGGVITIVGQFGTLTINPNGSYTYNSNPGSEGKVEQFTYTLTDGSGDTSTAKLLISIGAPSDKPIARTDIDDIPVGNSVATGNVITGSGTTSGGAGADTPGADGAIVTAITGTPISNIGGVITVLGQFGTLTINPDGSYLYNRNPGAPGGVTETFKYTLTDGTGDTSTADLLINIGTPVIPPGDDPSSVVITLEGADVLEGTHPDPKDINFVLKLDHAHILPVEVTYVINAISAQSPGDFFGVLTGTVTIPAGQTEFIVPVSIVQDHLVEPNEIFNIVLTNAVNATISPTGSTAQITIVDDDTPPLARDDSYDVVRGQPSTLSSVLTHKDPGEILDDSGDGPFETLALVPNNTVQPNGDFTIITTQGGTVVMHPDGTFIYTPPATLTGPDTFQYTITDAVNGVPVGNGTSTATVTLNPTNKPPTVHFDGDPTSATVNEAGLPVIGSNAVSDSEKTQRTFTLSDPDGAADLFSVTINGATIPLTELPGKVFATPKGEMTIDSYNPATGVVTFTYVLKIPVTDAPNQNEVDEITVTVTDKFNATSAPAKLPITIIDDVPTAHLDVGTVASGQTLVVNSLQGVESNDIFGADSKDLAGGVVGVKAGGDTTTPATGTPGTPIVTALGTLTLNVDGSYSYKANPNVSGTDTFVYTIKDSDGDLSTTTLSINVNKDRPPDADGTVTVDEAALDATGSAPGSSNETRDGTLGLPAGVTVVSGAQQDQTGAHGTLHVNTDGTFTYTLTKNVLNALANDGVQTINGVEAFTVATIDANGNSNSATITVNVIDDVPTRATSATPVTATVEEDDMTGAAGSDLSTGNNEDVSVDKDEATSAAGSLTALFTPGADQPLAVGLSGDTGGLPALLSSGQPVVYSVTGSVLTAYVDSGPAGLDANDRQVFTLTVSNNGSWAFDLKDQLDHMAAGGENTALRTVGGGSVTAIDFSGMITGTDADGDTVKPLQAGDFAITVQDDIPVMKTNFVPVVAAVDEDGLPTGNADATPLRTGETTGTGSAVATGGAGALSGLVSVGADEEPTFGLNVVTTPVNSGLDSKGGDVLIVSDGATLHGYVDVDGVAGFGAADRDVFTLTVDADGSYRFELKDQIDHAAGAGENLLTNALDLSGFIKATDKDGDTLPGLAAGAFAVQVRDDIPTMKTNFVPVVAAVDEDGLPTGNTDATPLRTGETTGTGSAVAAGGAGALNGLVSVGADEDVNFGLKPVTTPETLAGVTSNGGTISIVTDANGLHGYVNAGAAGFDPGVDREVFTLTVGSNGSYTFTLKDHIDHPTLNGLTGDDTENLLAAPLDLSKYIQATDRDGDAITLADGAFKIDVRDDIPVVANITQTTATEITGNLLTDPTPDASFGADNGWVQVLTVDGKTYIYDQKTDTTTGSTGTSGTFDTVTNQWTVTTSNSGRIVVDMDDGAYVYTPPVNPSGAKVETIGFTLTDRDGDTASANLTVNVIAPVLVVGQNVDDQTGQTTPHKVDPPGAPVIGEITGSNASDMLIGDIGGGQLQGKNTNVILMLDTSGSMMETFGSGGLTRLAGLQAGVVDALNAMANSGAENVRVHMNDFATDLKSSVTFNLVVNGVVNTAQLTAATNYVNGLTAPPEGWTNYEASLNDALAWVDGPNELTGPNVINQAVFVSDGGPNTALQGNTSTASTPGGLTAAQAMQQLTGTAPATNPAGADNVSEIAGIENRFGQIQAIGMGLDPATLAVMTQVEGAAPVGAPPDTATNTTNPLELRNVLFTNLTPNVTLSAVGNDVLTGGAGGDIMYGDTVNTDVLGTARALGLPTGAGWEVFERLETGTVPGSLGWTRADTLNYIRTHTDELAVESVGTGGATRAGGNDTITAGAGNDTVYGQEGNDIIIGGAGNDILSGGSGADTFSWNNADKGSVAVPAVDTIKDFNPTTVAANKDVLNLSDLLQGENAGNLSSYLTFAQTGADVTLSVQSTGIAGQVDQKIVLQGITMAQLAGSNPADSAGVIANLLANNKLITD